MYLLFSRLRSNLAGSVRCLFLLLFSPSSATITKGSEMAWIDFTYLVVQKFSFFLLFLLLFGSEPACGMEASVEVLVKSMAKKHGGRSNFSREPMQFRMCWISMTNDIKKKN